MKDTITKATDVLEILMSPAVQKEIKQVRPKFNRTDLVNEILDAWPHGQKGFAQSIYQEYMVARAGGSERQTIIRLISNLISEETASMQVRPVEDMSDAELAAAIKSVGPALSRIKEETDVTST